MDRFDGIQDLRREKGSLAGQIFEGIRASIVEGRLSPGARLPSWNDLAVQLGVARGTVRAAYERLADAQLITSSGAAGTHVTSRPPIAKGEPDPSMRKETLGRFRAGEVLPLPFQMGVPSEDLFPKPLWSRLLAASARRSLTKPASSPDPRGELGLRSEIAGYLAVARGMSCMPSQVFITNGYAGALGIVCRALQLHGKRGLMEDPGYLFARSALSWEGAVPIPVPVDEWGMQVEAGVSANPDASFALVTPGQQAPFGMTMSLERRHELLDWAASGDRWVIEDDYLGDLQLGRHAAPALASMDDQHVVHIGSFSKTISPFLRLGYLVVPTPLVPSVAQIVGSVDPAPAALVQSAVEAFLGQGHYLRHLRRMKRAYGERRSRLIEALQSKGQQAKAAGLCVLIELPDGVSDTAIAGAAVQLGIAPIPLSPWYAGEASVRQGLLLGVTNVHPLRVEDYVQQLLALIDRCRGGEFQG